MSLSATERERYLRHILLPELGAQGQGALKSARILMIGAGGLGSPILTYLAAAGVGTLGICDPDTVALSNLQRQILYATDDIGAGKAKRAAARLGALNPHPAYVVHDVAFAAENADALISGYDLIIEGLDRFDVRHVVNRACVAAGRPLLSAALGRFDGQVALFTPGRPGAACYACLVPPDVEDDVGCAAAGVLGAVAGVVGTLAATEAIKWICDLPGRLQGEMLIYDALAGRLRRVTVPRDPACTVCASP